MNDKAFKELLAAISIDLHRVFKAATYISPDQFPAPSHLSHIQQLIWNRLKQLLESISIALPLHCDECRDEFEQDMKQAMTFIDAIVSGRLTAPRIVWSVTFRSLDKTHGYSKMIYNEPFDAPKGYRIDTKSESVLFKEEAIDLGA